MRKAYGSQSTCRSWSRGISGGERGGWKTDPPPHARARLHGRHGLTLQTNVILTSGKPRRATPAPLLLSAASCCGPHPPPHWRQPHLLNRPTRGLVALPASMIPHDKRSLACFGFGFAQKEIALHVARRGLLARLRTDILLVMGSLLPQSLPCIPLLKVHACS
jgi:hypothetical protein